jgi:hypothetical protein
MSDKDQKKVGKEVKLRLYIADKGRPSARAVYANPEDMRGVTVQTFRDFEGKLPVRAYKAGRLTPA